MSIAQKIKKIANTLLIGALLLVLAANCYMMFARFVLHEQQPDVLGYSSAVVISGSMSGSIEINDMILIHEEDTYAVGDVITFYSGSSLVTHRIVGETERGFITKGDANNTADLYPVPIEHVVQSGTGYSANRCSYSVYADPIGYDDSIRNCYFDDIFAGQGRTIRKGGSQYDNRNTKNKKKTQIAVDSSADLLNRGDTGGYRRIAFRLCKYRIWW